ncbi:MAG TPA: DUF3570 domain-containing protein [Polyangia bacterium]|nr:DUF3570 domain-containing protein [Polyangia bacterium]
MKRLAFTALLAILGASLPGLAVRGDEVTIRGAYYREASTRVIQPVVEISQNLPHGFDVETHYLLDAITSASANAGAGKDSIFTELRNEVGLGFGKSWDRTRATLGYRYSTESDYWSHGLAGSLAERLWGDTATLALSVGVSFDQATARDRNPFCADPATNNCPLDVYYGGLSYTQVLSPKAVAQVDAETAYLDGFQGNLYRTVPNSSFPSENPPERRLRNAVAGRIAYYFPSTETGLQLHYRFYWDLYPGTSQLSYDAWAMRSHTIEGRIYQQLSPTLQARFLYRQYIQNKAAFWCDTLASPGCYSTAEGGVAIVAPYQSSDPKLGAMYTEYPEVKLLWEAEQLRDIPFFRWFASGTFEISYGYYYQSTSFGNAHVLQTGYTMPY